MGNAYPLNKARARHAVPSLPAARRVGQPNSRSRSARGRFIFRHDKNLSPWVPPRWLMVASGWQCSILMAGAYWLSAQRFGTREDLFESAQLRAFRDFSGAAVVPAVGVTKVSSTTTPSHCLCGHFLSPCLQELYHGFWSERDTKLDWK